MNVHTVLRRIDAMEQLLHDLRADVLKTEATTEEIAQVPGQGAWRRQMLVDLLPQVEHLRGVVTLLDLTAEKAPEAVAYQDVLERSGLSEQQQRNEHARLTKLATALFGRRTWPVQAWQQASDGVMRYRMPTKVAEWWTDVRRTS
jgi:hypothetical protein